MDYFAGLDVSLETASICIVNAAGDILLEKKIEAEPAAIIALLKHFGRPFKRIGLEAGPTSSWLYSELRCVGYPAICLECRHVKAGLSAMRNKTDRNDARGIAQLVRLGWFRQVHVKSKGAQQIRMLLVNRQQLLTKALDLENSVRGSLKVFGLRIGTVTRRTFEARVLELVAEDRSLIAITEPMLRVRRALIAGFERLDRLHPHRHDVHDRRLRRTIDRHLAFGHGIHFCPGNLLARLEGRVALEEVLKRFQDWELDEGALVMSEIRSVRGWHRMPTRI